MPRLAIIADDLTGALDAAAPFADAGSRVAVGTSPATIEKLAGSGADVIAVSTRSRDMRADDAAAAVKHVLSALPPGIVLFKKIDSRMKGNIPAEIEAFGAETLLVCPAIPDLDRRVKQGCMTGAGVERPIPVASALGTLAGHAIIPDVDRVDDIWSALRHCPEGALLVGARGLAMALASVNFRAAIGNRQIQLTEPAVLVIGSTDPVTLLQLTTLRNTRSDLTCVTAPGGAVPPPEKTVGPVTIIQAIEAQQPVAPDQVARDLSSGATAWVKNSRTIFACGGATAESLFDQLGATVLNLLGEVSPGIPVCSWNNRHLVTKSGGFGSPDVLAQLFAAGPEA